MVSLTEIDGKNALLSPRTNLLLVSSHIARGLRLDPSCLDFFRRSTTTPLNAVFLTVLTRFLSEESTIRLFESLPSDMASLVSSLASLRVQGDLRLGLGHLFRDFFFSQGSKKTDEFGDNPQASSEAGG